VARQAGALDWKEIEPLAREAFAEALRVWLEPEEADTQEQAYIVNHALDSLRRACSRTS